MGRERTRKIEIEYVKESKTEMAAKAISMAKSLKVNFTKGQNP